MYEFNINLSIPYPMHGFSLAPDLSKRKTYGDSRGISGKYKFDELATLHGNPDAISLSMGGNLAFDNGGGASISLGLMLRGKAKGKIGLYTAINSLKGIEASVGIDANFIFSDIPLNEFELRTLEGYTEGTQVGAGPMGESIFESYEGEYKGNWWTGKTFEKKRKVSHGYSYGLGVGPEDLSVSGSRFVGDTKFIGEITNLGKAEKNEK